MNKSKSEIVLDYIDQVKKHDEKDDDPITCASIEKKINYCKRQFDRIFKEYSKYTPFEVAERFRLFRSVEYISKGHTLVDAAYQFGYTPEGLSNAIRTKLNLTVKEIKTSGFELKKHIKISNSMVHLDRYKYQIEKKIYMDYITGLNEEKILKKITGRSPNSLLEDGLELHLDLKKILEILQRYDFLKISKKEFESIDLQEGIIMYVILLREYNSGKTKFEIPLSKLVSLFFIVGFFFNVETLNLSEGHYHLIIDDGLRIILNSLDEIERITNEAYDIILYSSFEGNKVILEFNPMFKEMLMIMNKV